MLIKNILFVLLNSTFFSCESVTEKVKISKKQISTLVSNKTFFQVIVLFSIYAYHFVALEILYRMVYRRLFFSIVIMMKNSLKATGVEKNAIRISVFAET